MVYDRAIIRSHRLNAGLRFPERIHKSFQVFTVGGGQLGLQSMGQAALQPSLPARAAIVEIRTAPCELAREVHPHPIGSADDAYQLPLGQYGTASNAGPLGNMPDTLHGSFLGHLHYKCSSLGRRAHGITAMRRGHAG